MTVIIPFPTVLQRRHIDRALILILGGDFAAWVQVAHISRKRKRLSDDLLIDLKHDDTLPATFDSLEGFRSYLISQHACLAAMRLSRPVWRRYRRWASKAEAVS